MAITETIEKRELIIALGANEAPASYRWNAMRFLRNEDGSDAARPERVSVPATAEEVSAHIGASVTSLLADIAADTARFQALAADHAAVTAERDALAAQLAQVTSERDQLAAELAAMAGEPN